MERTKHLVTFYKNLITLKNASSHFKTQFDYPTSEFRKILNYSYNFYYNLNHLFILYLAREQANRERICKFQRLVTRD